MARLSAIAGGRPEKSGTDLRAAGLAPLVPFAFGGRRAGACGAWSAAWAGGDGANDSADGGGSGSGGADACAMAATSGLGSSDCALTGGGIGDGGGGDSDNDSASASNGRCAPFSTGVGNGEDAATS
ncbi:MAG: hypothetical protein M5U16_15855 [Hyphomicrobium sp.]|nr:hypothetical protein [Hyphomicrobium sp.]